jgi:hypothetical protein
MIALGCAMIMATSAYAAPKILPDACGDPSILFNATVAKTPGPKPEAPSAGKAQLVFILVAAKKGGGSIFGIHDWTTRVGMDGKWLGAAGNNSFFAVDIAPGEHHLCATVQNSMSGAKDMIGMKKFTAEAGKVYFFQFSTMKTTVNADKSSQNFYAFQFDPVDEDEGEFRIKALPASTFAQMDVTPGA